MARTVLFGLKRIFFDRIFDRSYWTWRRHPAIIVPSMLGTAITVIEQSIYTLALVVFLTILAMRGMIPGFLSQLTQPGGIIAVFQNSTFALYLIPATVVSILGVLLAAIIGGGFVYSSEYGVYMEAWNKDEVSFGSIIENGTRNWKPMAWTIFLSTLLTWAPLALTIAVFVVSAFTATTLAGAVGLVVSSYVFYFGLGASLVLALFTVYSYPAVVIDNVSGLHAIKNSFGIAGRNLGVTLAYSVVRLVFQVSLALLVILTSFIGLPLASLSAAILALLLTPILHSTKTMIYYYAGPTVPEMPFELSNPIWYDISRRLPKAAWAK